MNAEQLRQRFVTGCRARLAREDEAESREARARAQFTQAPKTVEAPVEGALSPMIAKFGLR